MKIFKKIKFITALLLIAVMQFVLMPIPKAYAATSPTLGDVDSFSIMSYSGITDAAPESTTITGNIGVRPTTGTSITSACSSMNGGTIYTVDAAGPDCRTVDPTLLLSAMNANTAAYGNLVLGDNAPAGCTTIDNELGGQTLVPGLYCTAGNMTLNGTLTLSGTTGVWIFQSPSTLTTVGSAAKVVGGDPCNVWWHLPSEETGGIIGSGSQMEGNILALGAITFADGATLNGRALSQTSNVTLIGNTITKPTCTSTTTTTTSSALTAAGVPQAPYCPAFSCVTPSILESRRVSPTSLFLSWGPYAGINQFSVQYGVENGKWLYNTDVTGFSTTLNQLPPNQPIWVLISPRDNCSIGPCGVGMLVGGPKLPNTGFGSEENNIPWYVLVGSLAGISVFLSLIQRKYRFLSTH